MKHHWFRYFQRRHDSKFYQTTQVFSFPSRKGISTQYLINKKKKHIGDFASVMPLAEKEKKKLTFKLDPYSLVDGVVSPTISLMNIDLQQPLK